MVRVLLTGISGTGKSSLVHELVRMGHTAIDLDADAWSEWAEADPDEDPALVGTPVQPGRDWVWREDRVRRLLASDGPGVLFVSGCASNQRLFRSFFDHIILLVAPRQVIAERIATRTTNAYGKRPDEMARILSLIDTVEVQLRNSADHVIDTSASLADVAARIIAISRTYR